MATFNRSAAQQNFTPNPLVGQLVNSVYGVFMPPPLVFKGVNNGQRDVVPQYPGITVWNGESGFIESFLYDRWAQHALFSPIPNNADALAYDAVTGLWVPTPTGNPTISTLNIYNDTTAALQVKRFYSTLTPVLTTTTGTMINTGAHTLTGVTNKTYRVQIDSATTDWRTATFKWSSDNGVTWTAQNVRVATGATGGRLVLAPIILDNGVSILFSTGQYTLADYWTFIAIAANNQLYDLAVDTTNHIVKIGTSLYVANDANFRINKELGPNDPTIWFDSNAYIQYHRSTRQLRWTDDTRGIMCDIVAAAAAADSYFRLYYPLRFDPLTPPSTPPAGRGALYMDTAGAVQHPFWKDETPTTYDLTVSTNDRSFATPAILLGSGTAAGVATTVIRSDATIQAFDTTSPATIGIGSSVGVIAKAARRDHVHSSGLATHGDLLTVDAGSSALVALAIGGAGTALTSSGTMPAWADTLAGWCGDGSDGALSVATATTVTLTRTMYYSQVDLTDATSIINTAGFMLFCSGTITLNGGFIQNNGGAGGNGGNSTSTAGGSGGSAGSAGVGADLTSGNTGSIGGAGGNPLANGADSAGTGGITGDGGTGGRGGVGGDGIGTGHGTGGAAPGTVGTLTTRKMRTLSNWAIRVGGNTVSVGTGGTGGSGGGGGATGLGGGGGGGGGGGTGGPLFIAARAINYLTGTIQSKGGAGGNGGSGATGGIDGGAGGAGGGGGGGLVYLIYGSVTTGGTITAAGGTHGNVGAGTGSPGAGANGTAGYWITINLGTGVMTTTNS